MSTLTRFQNDYADVLLDLDFEPTPRAVPDHPIAALWLRTVESNGQSPVTSTKPNHPIAALFSMTVGGNGWSPDRQGEPNHPIARLFFSMVRDHGAGM